MTAYEISNTNQYVSGKCIYDVEEFNVWKGRALLFLQQYGENDFAKETARILTRQINGTNDEKHFKDVKGRLMALQESEQVSDLNIKDRKKKLFISHSTNDKEYVEKIVDLFQDMGLDEENIFCSSYAGFGIPFGEDVYDYLKHQFEDCDVHVFFILSDNYYRSAASLNEMGATWILKKNYDCILLPKFEFRDIRGVINPNKLAIKIDSDLDELKTRLGELKNMIISEFELKTLSEPRWEKKRDQFIKDIKDIKPQGDIDEDIIGLLKQMSEAPGTQLIVSKTLEGTVYQIGSKKLNAESDDRKIARLEAQIKKMEMANLVESINTDKSIYKLTDAGFIAIED